MYDKNHYKTKIISLQLIKINGKKKRKADAEAEKTLAT